MADVLSERDMAEWEVSFPALPGTDPVVVLAAYPTTDSNLPGWKLLKDWRHKVVYGVHDDLRPALRRVASQSVPG